MADDLIIYTGELKYRNIDFMFVFDGESLQMISTKDKRHEVEWEWLKTSIGKGIYTVGEPLKMEEPFLIGRCNETGNRMIFFTQVGESIGSKNSVLLVKVYAFVVCKYDRELIDRISFSGAEIDYIHPVNKAFKHTYDIEKMTQNGVFSTTIEDFNTTTTGKQVFYVDGKVVQIYFGISRKMSTRIGEAPISLSSSMMFEFEPTSEYSFIIRLWRIAREFIRFLCYRKNIIFSNIGIASPYEGGKHETFASLYIARENIDLEAEVLKSGRNIKQEYIDGKEGAILTDIANGSLYMRHIPNTYKSGRSIDASRFIMITAAFEWEFHRAYPEGVPKKESTVRIEMDASNAIQELIDSSTGDLKKKYKFLKKLIKSDSLQTEIIKMGEDYHKIIGGFGDHLYELNNEKLVYSEMGERLANQRNHFAHGDLDKEFIGLSLLDLIYLEYVVYALQLKRYGVDEDNVRKSINNLFHLNFML